MDTVRAPASSESAEALLEQSRAKLSTDAKMARELAARALDEAHAAGHAPSEALARLALGEACELLSSYDEALAHFTESVRLFTVLGDLEQVAKAKRSIGFTYDHLGDYTLALEFYLEALKIYEERGEDDGRAITLRTIGVTASKAGDPERGIEYYRESLAITERKGDNESSAKTLNNLGINLKNIGKYPESLAALEDALRRARKLQHVALEAAALSNLGITYDLVGRPVEAERAYEDSVMLGRRMSFSRAELAGLLGLGKHRLAGGRHAEAETALREALALASKTGNRAETAEAHQALAQALKAQGKNDEALQHFEAYHEIERSLVNADSQRRMRGMEVKLRLDQAQREAQLHRQKSAELTEAYDRLQAAAAEKNELLSQLERQNREDALTGIANRRHLDEELAETFTITQRTGGPLCVALIDIDHFKRINDSYSHGAGDQTLKEIARLLRANTRDTDLVARFGGEEFAIVFGELDLDGARRICERIRQAVEAHDWVVIHPWLKVTVSIGVTDSQGFTNHERLLGEADARLYAAKEAGRNRVIAAPVRTPTERAAANTKAESPTITTRDPRRELILAEQVRGSYSNLPIAYLGSLLVAALLCVVVRDLIPVRIWGPWLAAMGVLSFALAALHRAYDKKKPAGANAKRWGQYATFGALSSGLLWGMGTLLLHTPDSIDYQILVAVTAAIVGSSVAFASATYLPPFYAFFYPAVLPTAIMFITKTDATRIVSGVLLVIYLPIITRFAWNLNRAFIESMRLRFQNVSLVAELRTQKEAAEGANVAKSRFLAAASHDLRQPMHALGLFLQALRQGRLADRERKLVENIGESFNAMEGLFNALLDISRLDAGVVEPRERTFAVKRLLDRMRTEYTSQAAAKGVTLTVRECPAFVRTDSVLLEEIVGNFVSNAVRYTSTGRILVGARISGGDHLRIEVWDTGPGIPQDKQREVFREFVQLGNPERDRRKGLGLGLAIVERLSILLGLPVEVRSVPGRGSCFRVRVPIGRAEDAEPMEVDDEPRAVEPFQGRFIVVVDDEPAVLDAMSILLTAWGCEVAFADSGAMILGKLATAARKPDLVLCDYRLRNGESGIEVIGDIRAEFNEEIPAALITGDTGPDRLKEARESGLPLLHKPVKAARMRALMAQLLREAK
ncbi:diguanylate cyclase [Usitatibacter palustris]|uniref:Sensor histidine kinase RcsC n=1 Tax=Usitatibacter palustris TaxID=2732487 RepID=A0A6M4HAJ0_9PROT|nr:diguanylate cyclase [Usitatibacter palustris]QJR16571.1 Sensor histidine kinase RcsC [Usitatibacter palustris]